MCLQTTIYNFLRIAESSPTEWKTLSVFKRLVLQTREKPGLVWESVKNNHTVVDLNQSIYCHLRNILTLPNKSSFLLQRSHNRVKAVLTWKLRHYF